MFQAVFHLHTDDDSSDPGISDPVYSPIFPCSLKPSLSSERSEAFVTPPVAEQYRLDQAGVLELLEILDNSFTLSFL
jgi:hypothetical protein